MANVNSQTQYYNNADVRNLILSLDRKEDGNLFATDVLTTHPLIAEEYTTVCPKRCDLGTAAKQAMTGMYSGDAMLHGLRRDVQLMGDNCIRFNGADSDYAATARRFLEFATQAIDQFIVTHAAAIPEELYPPNPSPEELMALVQQLNRREDENVFLVDVPRAFPDLAKAYLTVCPHVMSIELMQEKVRRGDYVGHGSRVWGQTVADSLVGVRRDVELIVRNCITFNAKLEDWVKRAESFQRFAHRQIDDFVLRFMPSLRSTLSGVKKYAKERGGGGGVVGQKRGRSSLGEKGEGVHHVPNASSLHAPPPPPPQERPHVMESPCATAVPRRTAFQPPLALPSSIRRRLVYEHLNKDAMRPLFVGTRCSKRMLTQSAFSQGASNPEVGKADADGEEEVVEVPVEYSARSVLKAYRRHISQVFSEQRRQPVVEDVSKFSKEEEAVYMDVVRVVEKQFNRVFLAMLLYEKEAVEARAYALSQRATSWSAAVGNEQGEKDGVDWLGVAHYLYLVRFVVHLPQVASLCCCEVVKKEKSSTDGVSPRPAPPSQLYLSSRAKPLIAHVRAVTENFLQFIEDYEKSAVLQ